MNHANKPHSSLEFDHDRATNIPSKDTQPPIPQHKSMIPQGGLFDRETQVYWTKQYRQFWATAPATAIAVLAGVFLQVRRPEICIDGLTGSIRKRQDSHAIVCFLCNPVTSTDEYSKHFSSIPGAFKYTYKTEGIRGFWAGTTPLVIIQSTC